MEFHEKLQQLRKQQGMTQEQLAGQLFVSRTAVSKWETGRGMPSMESLKMIAGLFHVSLDQLLSSEEIVVIAGKENEENFRGLTACMEGIINLMALFSQFLPLYKAEEMGIFYAVPLYRLDGWREILFWSLPVIMGLCGAAQILRVGAEKKKLGNLLRGMGTGAHILAILLLILCGHPYPAALFFFLLVMKGILLLKKRK